MMDTVTDNISGADGMRYTHHVRLLTASMMIMTITIAALDDPNTRGNAVEVPQLDLIFIDKEGPVKVDMDLVSTPKMRHQQSETLVEVSELRLIPTLGPIK